jgi:hypothetical protein
MMLIAAVLLVASLVGAYFGTVTSQSDEAAVIGIPWNSVLAMFIAHFLVLLSSHAMSYSYAAISSIVGLCKNLQCPIHSLHSLLPGIVIALCQNRPSWPA